MLRAVVQRVSRANVRVDGEVKGQIGSGLLVLLGVGHEDDEHDAGYLAEKIVNLRIFQDQEGKMNISVKDREGNPGCFPVYALWRLPQGKRPSYSDAAFPDKAEGCMTCLSKCANQYTS